MEIRKPELHHTDALRQLWKTAFGDPDAFLDLFFRTGFSPDRCRCLLEEGCLAAALYWFDCEMNGQKMAYLYAVATHPDFRGKGFCRMLMEDTHTLLRARGYDSAILVPQKESLRKMYAGMGYQDAGGLKEITCTAADTAVPTRSLRPEEFAALRRAMLPENAVLQEGAGLRFLAEQLQFFAGEDFLMAAWAEADTLRAAEYLGSPEKLPGILRALGYPRGVFRMPGNTIPFAMFHPLTRSAYTPEYFGFAFD